MINDALIVYNVIKKAKILCCYLKAGKPIGTNKKNKNNGLLFLERKCRILGLKNKKEKLNSKLNSGTRLVI